MSATLDKAFSSAEGYVRGLEKKPDLVTNALTRSSVGGVNLTTNA